MAKNEIQGKRYIDTKGKIGYTMSSFSYLFSVVSSTFISFFATESLGIAIGATGVMIMLVKIFDGITDVICGVLIDRSRSKYGKSRPWFLRMAIPYGLSLFLTFCIPASWGSTAKIIALGAMYALTVSVFGTFIGVAKFSLLTRMSPNAEERGSTSAICEGLSTIVAGLVMGQVINLSFRFGWPGTFAIFGAVATITALLTFFLTREYNEELNDALQKNETASTKELVSILVKNKYAILLLIFSLVTYIGHGFLQSSGNYWWVQAWGRTDMVGKSSIAGIFVNFIGIALLNPLTKKFGHKKIIVWGGVCTIVFRLLHFIFLQEKYIYVLMILGNLCGVSGIIVTATVLPVLAADSVDYGEWQTGKNAAGVLTSVLNVGQKIGTALASAIFGALMAYAGYQSGGVAQTAHTVSAIKTIYIIAPGIVFGLVGLLVFLTWDLDKKLPAIREELAARKASKNAE